MYTQYWGLEKSPFAGSTRGDLFYKTSGQIEAMARIDYVIKNGRRCGVLIGEAGQGKTSVLANIEDRERIRGNIAVGQNLMGISQSEFVTSLAGDLGCHPRPGDSFATLWQSIFDRLKVNQYQSKNTVLLFDDAHLADASVLTAIGRLSQWNPAHETRLTILLSTTVDGVSQLGRRLLELCDLRIELRDWRLEDTIGYIRSTAESLGGSPALFDNAALDALHTVSEGNPRSLRRLAELALVAGAGQKLKQIDAGTVYAVDGELRMRIPSAAA